MAEETMSPRKAKRSSPSRKRPSSRRRAGPQRAIVPSGIAACVTQLRSQLYEVARALVQAILSMEVERRRRLARRSAPARPKTRARSKTRTAPAPRPPRARPRTLRSPAPATPGTTPRRRGWVNPRTRFAEAVDMRPTGQRRVRDDTPLSRAGVPAKITPPAASAPTSTSRSPRLALVPMSPPTEPLASRSRAFRPRPPLLVDRARDTLEGTRARLTRLLPRLQPGAHRDQLEEAHGRLSDKLAELAETPSRDVTEHHPPRQSGTTDDPGVRCVITPRPATGDGPFDQRRARLKRKDR